MDLLKPGMGLFAVTFLLFLVFLVILYVMYKKLTPAANIAALVVGGLVVVGTGTNGVILLFTYFALAVQATSHHKELKSRLTVDGRHPQKRDAAQVIANGGIVAIMAGLAWYDKTNAALYHLMLAAALAAALADTWSSELGIIYGRRHYNILTFTKEERGLDGVVSIEGTLIGAAGALIIALIYAGFTQQAMIVLVAGIFGNLADSVLGATLERRHIIGNNTVNFLNTLLAALLAMLLHYCI
ncbi:DUF92 domain-containing protein [Chitinophaga rhizophila]|uniref:DUF92 domain-containing protein n=1 Tax=Chitinophaga rhizophila TaxID=2866212 RepID=A0ABS7GHX3_9BACT|nr:DUF92 domain-containing protein [Chitinophaga rhizophila]MBW8687292.1 DUF92 domain-containing protein [Chitinophaga rhizophila]